MGVFPSDRYLYQRVEFLQGGISRYFQAPPYWRIAIYENNFDPKSVHVLHRHVDLLVDGDA